LTSIVAPRGIMEKLCKIIFVITRWPLIVIKINVDKIIKNWESNGTLPKEGSTILAIPKPSEFDIA